MIDKGLPPFVRSWTQFYILVVLWLAVFILILYGFTCYFS